MVSRTPTPSEGPGSGPWEVAAPEQHGLDPERLEQAATRLAARGDRQSLVVVRDGRIVFERYWANAFHHADPTWKNASYSLGKSWGSTMVGCAISDGVLGLDDLVSRHHPPERSGLGTDVTVRHLLTMSSGGTLVVKGSTTPLPRLGQEPPPVVPNHYVRQGVGEPGSPEGYGVSIPAGRTFYYDGAASDHLADVVASAVGRPSLDYMMERVVAPLGCENFTYQPQGIDENRNVRIGGSILLSCRDAARLGQLYLNGGRWDGRQLVDQEYVAAATAPSELNPSYGFLWWLNHDGLVPKAPRSMYFAHGSFGQFCCVLPEQRTVIATMGFVDRDFDPTFAWDALSLILDPVPTA